MKNILILFTIAFTLSACAGLPRPGTSLVSTGKAPETNSVYRVEKYEEPKTIEGVYATHAIITDLYLVDSSKDHSIKTTYLYYSIDLEDAHYYATVLGPQVCEDAGLSLRNMGIQRDLTGIRGIINLSCR